MVWSGGTAGAAPQRIYIAKMSNPWTIDGSSIVISTPTFTWERNGAAINEGPQPLYNASGKLFIVFSGSSFASDQYCLGLLTLKDNGDPLNPSNWAKTATPIFSMSAASNAYGPGHNGFFKSPDGTEDWIVYHARTGPRRRQHELPEYQNAKIYMELQWHPQLWNACSCRRFSNKTFGGILNKSCEDKSI